MEEPAEKTLAYHALTRGWVTNEQMVDARSIRTFLQEIGLKLPLGKILQILGFISETQLEELLQLQPPALRQEMEKAEDRCFGQIAINQGIISERDLTTALMIQQRGGTSMRLGSIMVARLLISDEQRQQIWDSIKMMVAGLRRRDIEGPPQEEGTSTPEELGAEPSTAAAASVPSEATESAASYGVTSEEEQGARHSAAATEADGVSSATAPSPVAPGDLAAPLSEPNAGACASSGVTAAADETPQPDTLTSADEAPQLDTPPASLTDSGATEPSDELPLISSEVQLSTSFAHASLPTIEPTTLTPDAMSLPKVEMGDNGDPLPQIAIPPLLGTKLPATSDSNEMILPELLPMEEPDLSAMIIPDPEKVAQQSDQALAAQAQVSISNSTSPAAANQEAAATASDMLQDGQLPHRMLECYCGHQLPFVESYVGHPIKCNNCQIQFIVPPPSPEDELLKLDYHALVGIKIRDYRLDELLAVGNAGPIYRATSSNTNQTSCIAIRLIRPALFNAQEQERWIKDIRTLALLNLNIFPKIIDLRKIGPYHFLLTEFIQGKPLWQVFEEKGPLEILRAIEILQTVVLGLSMSYEENLIHGNLSPANIYLTAEDKLKILDMPRCTVKISRYQAPELLQGATPHMGSDLFSLGASIYHLVTGKFPFEDLPRTTSSPAPAVQTLRPTVGPTFSQILQKLTALDHTQRYQDIPSLLQDLEQAEQEARQQSKSA